MRIGQSVRQRALSGIVAFAMLVAVTPFGVSSGAADPVALGGSTAPFAQLKSSAPSPGLGARDERADLVNVQWRAGVTSAQIQAAAKRFGFTPTATSKLGWTQLKLKGSDSSGVLVRTLREARLVADAKPSVLEKALDVMPNDPLFSSQWALKNTGQDHGTPGADIGATKAWEQTKGSSDAIVAVVDEGVDWHNSDLTNNMWINAGEVPNNGIDDDHDGYVDDVRGWDFRNRDNSVYDVADGDRHGTHVAGIIGAEGDNGVGISGVNQHVRIMPLKFIGGDGYGTDFDAANAIVYAVDHKATVINCSWGGGDSDLIKDAVDYAASKGVIMSCAAGNEYSNNDNPGSADYPASYDTTNVISVAASDRNDKIAEWSNYGEDSVDLAAPGVDVTSTMPAEQVGFYTDALSYKAVYLPVQAEILQPASARDAIITGAVSQLGEATDTPILVVDDSAAKVTSETQGVRLKVYTDALAAGGFPNVATWVTDAKGTPTQAAMQGRIVVWFTGKDTGGWYSDYCLTAAEQRAIASFLDAGGRFVLISGKAATDLQFMGGMADNLDLIAQYFGAKWFDLEHWGRDFEGRSGTRLAGVNAEIPEAYMDSNGTGKLWPTASDAVSLSRDSSRTTTIMYTGQYAALSGTSMAAPQVTGAIALLRAKFPSISSDELVARVLNTVDRKPAFAGKTATGGRLDVAAAMNSYPGRVTITAPKKGDHLLRGSAATLRWTPAVAAAVGATYTAQIGLPYTAFSNGFEDGMLGTFVEPTESATPWVASTDAVSVHSGSYGAKSGALPPMTPAPDIGPDWYRAGLSAMEATITVPDGGGDLSFDWRMPDSDGWDTLGVFATDGANGMLDASQLTDPKAWTHESYHLTAGDHLVVFVAYNYTKLPSDIRLNIDDITLTAHQFSDIGKAGAGATSLNFTLPDAATNDAWFRVQSHLAGVDSAWATVKGCRLVNDWVAPAPPSALTLIPDRDGNVGLRWNNPADPDFDHVLVLASTDHVPSSRDDSAVVAYEGTGTVATFGPIVDGGRVFVSAWAVDTSGNWSAVSSAQTTAVDRTPPSPVRSLRVLQPQAGLPVVLWSAGAPTSDTATVLRSYTGTPTVGDPNAMSVDVGQGSAVDWGVNPGAREAFYTVYETDPSGNVSLPRSVHVMLDSNAVAGAVSVEATKTDPNTGSAIVETTTAWVHAAVSNATDMRVSLNGEADSDGDWVPFQSRFPIQFLPIHGQQTVTVEFRRTAAEVPTVYSASALVMLHRPLAPNLLTAQAWNTGLKLGWDTHDDPTLSSYVVEEAPTALGPWTPVAMPQAFEMNGARMFVGGLSSHGPHYFRVIATDVLGRAGDPSQTITGTVGAGTRRFSGVDRVRTAAAASAGMFTARAIEPTASDTVVIAPDSDYVQALAANSLAGRYGASVLVAGASLPSATAAEILRLGVHKALIVGTQSAISPAVDAALRQLGLKVDRITASDRYGVAANVAARLSVVDGSRDALVVNGGSRADMCALMPVAYSSGRPVIVVKRTSMPPAFKALIGKVPLDSAMVIGGTSAVSTAVTRQFGGLTEVSRVSGRTSAGTAAKLASWAVRNQLATWDNVSVANPALWAQSLNIGAASHGGVVLLTSAGALSKETASALRSNAKAIGIVDIFGGLGTVSSSVQSKIHTAISIQTGPIMDPPVDSEPPDGGGDSESGG